MRRSKGCLNTTREKEPGLSFRAKESLLNQMPEREIPYFRNHAFGYNETLCSVGIVKSFENQKEKGVGPFC